MADRRTPRIAVMVDTSTGWGRRLIRGVVGYANKHGPWNLWVHASGQDERVRLPPGWRGDGIIARISDYHTARHVAAARVPVVNVSGTELRGVDFCRVTTDLGATGRLAAGTPAGTRPEALRLRRVAAALLRATPVSRFRRRPETGRLLMPQLSAQFSAQQPQRLVRPGARTGAVAQGASTAGRDSHVGDHAGMPVDRDCPSA